MKHIYVSGEVQGVGYRQFAHEQALINGIKGWACNLADGRVEIMALAETDRQLDRFLEQLQIGPSKAHVQNVSAELVQPDYNMTAFTIRRDGGLQ